MNSATEKFLTGLKSNDLLLKLTWDEWLALWALLGFGVILKQSVLVFLPSLALYAWIERRNLVWRRELLWQPLIGAVMITAISTPMIAPTPERSCVTAFA